MPRKEVVTYTKKLDIPEDKIAEYKEAFDMFDIDGSGTLTVDEIVKIMKNFGYPIKHNEAKKMIDEIDVSGDGELDFEEFVTLMEKTTQYIDETDEELVLRAFKSFDKNNDGKITNYEFKYILTQMGQKMSDEDANLLFEECDLDVNGELDYENFINFWKKQ